MKLLALPDTDHAPSASRFRHSPAISIVFALLLLSITVALICWYVFGQLPRSILIFSGGTSAAITLISISTIKRAFSPANWILLISPQTVQVKFRSYLNAHFPANDPQVLQFSIEQLASACITKQTIRTPGSKGGNTTSFHSFLDFHFAGTDLQALKEQIKYERNCVAPKTGRWIKSSTKYRHYPVSVVDQNTVRIAWRSPCDRISPNIKTAIQQLSRQGVKIDPPQKEKIDLTRTADDQTAMEDKILQLAERGNMLAAIKLTRRTYSMSLTAAKAFVEDLLQ